MAGSREWGEVKSYPVDATDSFDSKGYTVVADQGTDDRVHKHDSATAADYDGTNPIIGVNYVSTEDQDGVVQNLAVGDELDVVTESAGFEVHAEAETYNVGDDLYLSQNTDGRVNKTDTTSTYFGTVVESADYSGGANSDDNFVKAQFTMAAQRAYAAT